MTIHDADNKYAFAFGSVEGVTQLYERGFITADAAMKRISEIVAELNTALVVPPETTPTEVGPHENV